MGITYQGGKAKGKIESEGKVAKGDDGDDNSEDNDGKEQPELPPKAAKVTEEVPLTRRERYGLPIICNIINIENPSIARVIPNLCFNLARFHNMNNFKYLCSISIL